MSFLAPRRRASGLFLWRHAHAALFFAFPAPADRAIELFASQNRWSRSFNNAARSFAAQSGSQITLMKNRFTSLLRRKFTALSLLAGSLLGLSNAEAQSVYLTFTGGGGTPVVVSWSTQIVYTLSVTTTNGGVNPYFVFDAIPNIASAVPVDTVATFSGAPTYSSTGVGAGDGTQTINSFYTVSPHGQVSADDLVFRATLDTAPTLLTAGDVITLSAGSLHNSNNYSGVMPTNGFYNTFIVDASYLTNLGTGTAVPEPSTYALFAGAAMLGAALWRRRRQRAAAATA